MIKLANSRLGYEKEKQRQQRARRGSHIKRRTPSVHRSHHSTDDIPQSRSHGNREVENAHDAPTLILGKHVGHECWRQNHETCLANSHERMPNEQPREIMREGRQQRCAAPDKRSHDDYDFLENRSANGPTNGAAHM